MSYIDFTTSINKRTYFESLKLLRNLRIHGMPYILCIQNSFAMLKSLEVLVRLCVFWQKALKDQSFHQGLDPDALVRNPA